MQLALHYYYHAAVAVTHIRKTQVKQKDESEYVLIVVDFLSQLGI